jgi:hypothetical protein
MDEQIALSLTPRLIAVKTASERQGTVLTVSLCRALIRWLVARRADVTGIVIYAGRKTVKTVSGSQSSLFTAINRGVTAVCS